MKPGTFIKSFQMSQDLAERDLLMKTGKTSLSVVACMIWANVFSSAPTPFNGCICGRDRVRPFIAVMVSTIFSTSTSLEILQQIHASSFLFF
jgi:hypothetical protein